MKTIIQKQPFFGDFSFIKSISLASIPPFSRLLLLCLLVFSSTLLLNFNAIAVVKSSQQVPVKKVTQNPLKSASPSKTVKSNKGKKGKKSIVIKKDTLFDIDPASAKSPLYDH